MSVGVSSVGEVGSAFTCITDSGPETAIWEILEKLSGAGAALRFDPGGRQALSDINYTQLNRSIQNGVSLVRVRRLGVALG